MKQEQLLLIEGDKYYVYLLGRPSGIVFYVGKGCNDRVDDHEREARGTCKCAKCQIIRNIWREGGQIIKRQVFFTDSEQDALQYEAHLIKKFGKQLVNKKHGRRFMKPIPILIEGMSLRVPRARRTKEERRRQEIAQINQRVARLNVLESRLHGAIRRHRHDLIDRLEAEMDALEILLHPRSVEQLKLFD